MIKIVALLGLASTAIAVPQVVVADGSDSSGTHHYQSTCDAGRPRFTNTSSAASTGGGVLEFRTEGQTLTLAPGESGVLEPGPDWLATAWEAWFFDAGQEYQFDGGTFSECFTPPAIPTGLTATPGAPGEVVLAWVAPTAGDGPATSGYVIERSLTGTDGWTVVADGVVATTYAVTGLANGTTYHFRVIARNAAGDSSPSTLATAVPRSVSTAPQILRATPGNGQVRLDVAPPTVTGGAPIVDYIVQRSTNGGSAWSTVADSVSASPSVVVSGLTNGATYHFRVIAVNAAGNSAPSSPVAAVPRTVPGAVRSVTATPVVSGQVLLAWLAPSTNGGATVTDYIIQSSPNGTTGWTTINDGVRATTGYTVTGLTNGTRYYFRIYARNAAGDSPAAAVNAIPRSLPSAVRSLSAAPAASGQVRLAWSAPATTGGAITDYVIQRSPNGTSNWVTVNDGVRATTGYTVTGLTNGTRYHFRVYARNAAGNSPTSTTVNTIPRTVPTAARSLVAVPGTSGQVRLTWSAPASTGGSAITDYVIQRSPNGTTNWVTVNDGVRATTGYTVTGLTNGTRYYFRIYARNAAGNSPTSTTVNTIPRTVPGAPTVRASAGTNSVTLAWTPGSTGGSAVTRYVVQRSVNGSTWTSLSTTVSPTTRTYVATGLTNGTRYYFRIAAVNGAGTGHWSSAVSAVPVAASPRCDPSYPTVCIPPGPPDLDCADIPYRNFPVVGSDPHGLDSNDPDNIACET